MSLHATHGVLLTALAGALAAASGCSQADESCLLGKCPEEATGQAAPEPTATQPAPLCTSTGRERTGLGNTKLSAKRAVGVVGADRGRMKPYSALLTEYARVLGADNTPALIAQTGDTFGQPPPRAFVEPEPNAVSVFTAYRAAFEGCLRFTGAITNAKGVTTADPRFAVAPTPASAAVECAAWAHRFWSRAATPEEVNECVAAATVESSKEDQTNGSAPIDTTPARRWAYACASVLTSTGFLSY